MRELTKRYEICPGGYDQGLSEFKRKDRSTNAYSKIPKDAIQMMSALHSDLAFVGSDGKVHLVKENLKPDYSEWNW